MNWIWQRSGWPDFTWNQAELEPLEARFRHDAGRRIGAWRRLGTDEQIELRVGWLSDEAAETSAIEGEFLDRDSVQSSVRRQFGLAHDGRPASPAEAGVAEMMVSVYREFDHPLDHRTLWDWHRMLMRERHRLNVIGGYRRHAEPMQVVSGPDHRPTVHYVAPPSARVTMEMDRFIAWYERASAGRNRLAPLTCAGAAHLYFVFIHPFEDGNGRIGRALSEKALARALGQPSLIALARAIFRRRRAYYDALKAANESLDITGWLTWFAAIVLDAQTWSERRLVRTMEQTRLFDRLRGRLNPRQGKALLRLFRAEPDGFEGGLSADNYRRITGAPASTATRDLADLVAKGALRRTGARRYTRYRAIGSTCHHSMSSPRCAGNRNEVNDERLQVNRRNWNERTPVHAATAFYDVEGFKAGRIRLTDVERREVGDVDGKTLLHLQCHFGLDTMSWARLGAKATGVDFSDAAIDLARSLNDELELNTRFIRSDVYDLPDVLDEEFDIVFTSYGVLVWLPDLDRWASTIQHLLRPGGTFHIVKFHPFVDAVEVSESGALHATYGYFHREVSIQGNEPSYAGAQPIESPAYEWQHTLGDVVTALIEAGLTIEFLHEFPFCSQEKSGMERCGNGRWRFPNNGKSFPHRYSIKATN